MILAPDVETRPAPEQFRLDDASYRSQLGYLLERSPLYRQKLAEAGVNSAAGVNVFPSAVREVVSGFAPQVSGHIVVAPRTPGVGQEPPLPVSVELARDHEAETVLAEAIRQKLRDVLVVQTRVDLVPWGSLPRSEYKSKLVKRQ